MDGQMNRSTRPNYCFVYRHQKKIALVLVPLVMFFLTNTIVALLVFALLFYVKESDNISDFRKERVLPVHRFIDKKMDDDEAILLIGSSLFHAPFALMLYFGHFSTENLRILFLFSTAVYFSFVILFHKTETRWIRLLLNIRHRNKVGTSLHKSELGSNRYNYTVFIVLIFFYIVTYSFFFFQNLFPLGVSAAILIFINWVCASLIMRCWQFICIYRDGS